MSLTEGKQVEHRRIVRLAPLIVLGNTFLLLCVVGLFAVAIRQNPYWKHMAAVGNASHRMVDNQLANRVPDHEYLVRK